MDSNPTIYTTYKDYSNCSVKTGPITAQPGAVFKELDGAIIAPNGIIKGKSSDDSIIEKCYKIFMSQQFLPLSDIKKHMKKFDSWSLDDAKLDIRFIKDEKEELLSIACFLNGEYLDIKKLPRWTLKN